MKVLASLLVLAGVVSVGLSIKCYQCTSFVHSQCADEHFYTTLDDGTNHPAADDLFLKDCPATAPNGEPYTMCRKIYQNVRDDERVIRGCAYEEYKDKGNKEAYCYKTVLEEYNTYVCQCPGKDDKGCNGSTSLSAMSVVAVTAAALVGALLK